LPPRTSWRERKLIETAGEIEGNGEHQVGNEEYCSAGACGSAGTRHNSGKASRDGNGHQLDRLPVVENGRLVGIVAQADIALSENETKTGELVEAISEPSAGERS
jgi:hypothetical protein